MMTKCECEYPDVTRIFDDHVNRVRVLYCVKHGTILSPTLYVESSRNTKLPTESWRAREASRKKGELYT